MANLNLHKVALKPIGGSESLKAFTHGGRKDMNLNKVTISQMRDTLENQNAIRTKSYKKKIRPISFVDADDSTYSMAAKSQIFLKPEGFNKMVKMDPPKFLRNTINDSYDFSQASTKKLDPYKIGGSTEKINYQIKSINLQKQQRYSP